MFDLYKKVEKSIEYPRGAKKIESENPFDEGPCLLCISAQDNDNRSIFGLTKQGVRMARIRVREDKGAKFSVGYVPINFLSIKTNLISKNNKETKEIEVKKFVERYIKPLVIDKEGKIISTDLAMKKMRNINIMSNCDGTKRALAIINEIKGVLLYYNFDESEIKTILSQISLISFQTEVDLSNCPASVIDFHNLNDREVTINNLNIDDEMVKRTRQSELGESVEVANDNRIEVLINGEDTHQIRDYLNQGQATPVIVYKIMTSILENSVLNSNSNGKFIPISVKDLFEKAKSILLNAEQGISKEEQVDNLDELLSYGGVIKLTDRELALIAENEESVEEYNRTINKINSLDKKTEQQDKSIAEMLKNAEENCTESTYLKILETSGYQLSNEKKRKCHGPSDKELIESKQAEIKKLQSMLKRTIGFADTVRKSTLGKIFFGKSIKKLSNGEDFTKE